MMTTPYHPSRTARLDDGAGPGRRAGSGENSSAHTYGVAQARPHAGSVTAGSDARAEVINAQLMSDLQYRNGGPRTYRGRARRLFYAETITSAFSLRFTPPLTFLGPAAGDECSARTGLLFMGQGAAGEEEIVVRVHRLARCSWRAAGPGGRTNSIFVYICRPGALVLAGRLPRFDVWAGQGVGRVGFQVRLCRAPGDYYYYTTLVDWFLKKYHWIHVW
jgi:hypothetical protein